MPVIKNEGYNTIELGTGDILIHKTRTDSSFDNGICFKEHEPRKIGNRTEEYAGMEIEKFEPSALLVFYKRESVEVLIEMLQEIRDQFPN